MSSRETILILGAGEMASAVAWHLRRAGFRLLMTELPDPNTVRRLVAFSEAVRHRAWTVEGVTARLVAADAADFVGQVRRVWRDGEIAVVVEPDWRALVGRWPEIAPAGGDAAARAAEPATTGPQTADAQSERPDARNPRSSDALQGRLETPASPPIIDARLLKRPTEIMRGLAPLAISLGPGNTAGEQVDVVIETNRGHNLGRIITEGQAEPNTHVPGNIAGKTAERVHRAPTAGIFRTDMKIGDVVEAGDVIGYAADACGNAVEVRARIAGRVRGLLADGHQVHENMKLGDVDPRGREVDPATISDKGRTIAAGVLTALLGRFKEER